MLIWSGVVTFCCSNKNTPNRTRSLFKRITQTFQQLPIRLSELPCSLHAIFVIVSSPFVFLFLCSCCFWMRSFCAHAFGNTWLVLLWLVFTSWTSSQKRLWHPATEIWVTGLRQHWPSLLWDFRVWENIKLISMEFQQHSFDKGTFLVCFNGVKIVVYDRMRRKERKGILFDCSRLFFVFKQKEKVIQSKSLCSFVLLWGRFSQNKNWNKVTCFKNVVNNFFLLFHMIQKANTKKKQNVLFFWQNWPVLSCKKHQQTKKLTKSIDLFSPFLFFVNPNTRALLCEVFLKGQWQKQHFQIMFFIFTLKYFILSRTTSQSVFLGGNVWSEKDKKDRSTCYCFKQLIKGEHEDWR